MGELQLEVTGQWAFGSSRVRSNISGEMSAFSQEAVWRKCGSCGYSSNVWTPFDLKNLSRVPRHLRLQF